MVQRGGISGAYRHRGRGGSIWEAFRSASRHDGLPIYGGPGQHHNVSARASKSGVRPNACMQSNMLVGEAAAQDQGTAF